MKIWGSLCYDDQSWIATSDFELGAHGLFAVLIRTKTTGAGRKVMCLPLYVDKGASLTGLPWLEADLKVWKEQALFAGDYFLPLGTLDGEAALEQWASYADAAAAGRALLGELDFPLSGGGEGSVPDGVAPFWTKQGRRAALSSWLAALDVEKSRRDYVGRWSPSGSDTYVRTYSRAVGARQLQAKEAARTGAGHELYGEERLGAGVKKWLMHRWGG